MILIYSIFGLTYLFKITFLSSYILRKTMKKAEHVPHSCILMQLLSNDIYIFKESDSEHAVGVNCLKDWKRNQDIGCKVIEQECSPILYLRRLLFYIQLLGTYHIYKKYIFKITSNLDIPVIYDTELRRKLNLASYCVRGRSYQSKCRQSSPGLK